MENDLLPNPTINIQVKPTGISSVWNWLTNRNKKASLKNAMYDKRFRLKLNPEELDALKRYGVDLEKLQAIAASTDGKMRKNIVIIPKDQNDKNVRLNNSILSELLKNKSVSIRQQKSRRSLISSSSLSIKSKANGINSKITYVHSIKSKKSVYSVTSKASLKVGLKCKTDFPTNKNIIMKGIPEELLKGNKQKKIFIPIYVGKKKSSNKNVKTEKSKVIKNGIENDPNVIPLLLTKLKTMEGKISDIENTTKMINETVSQKNMLDKNNLIKPSKKRSHSLKSNTKASPAHKLYKKRSLKKQNKTESKIATPSSNYSNYNTGTDISFNSLTGLRSTAVKMNNRDAISKIKTLLDNPDNLLKHHAFILPNKISEKTLFKANPNVGCDVLLKIFEALTEANEPTNVTGSNVSQPNRPFIQNVDMTSPQQNMSDTKSEEKPKVLSSISETLVARPTLINIAECRDKNCSIQKKNISCPSSSTDVNYIHQNVKQNLESDDISSMEILNGISFENSNMQMNNNIRNLKNSEELHKKSVNLINTPSPEIKTWAFLSKNESEEHEVRPETLIEKESFPASRSNKNNERNSSNPSKREISTFIRTFVENNMQSDKNIRNENKSEELPKKSVNPTNTPSSEMKTWAFLSKNEPEEHEVSPETSIERESFPASRSNKNNERNSSNPSKCQISTFIRTVVENNMQSDKNIRNENNSEELHKKSVNTINTPSSEIKTWAFHSKNDPEGHEVRPETSIEKESFPASRSDNNNERSSSNSSNCQVSTFTRTVEENNMQSDKPVHENIIFESIMKNNNDNISTKSEENINLQSLQLQVPEGKMSKQIIRLPITTDSANICSICIEPAVDLNPAKHSEVEIKGSKLFPEAKTEPKFSITILVKNNVSDEVLNNNENNTSTNDIESAKHSLPELPAVQEDLRQSTGNARKNYLPPPPIPVNQDGPYKNHTAEKNITSRPNSKLYTPHFPDGTSITSPTIKLPLCSFVNKTSSNTAKPVDKINVEKKTNDFGIEGGSYLNQEQRKKLEAENLVNNKKSEELKYSILKPGAKSSVNLKNNSIQFRHLSESSLNFHKTTERNTYHRITLPSCRTQVKSIKNCRKYPYDLLECLKIRKGFGVDNKMQAEHPEMKLRNGQGFNYLNKAIMRNENEIYAYSNYSNNINSMNCYDVLNRTQAAINDKTGFKQEFFVVCNEKPLEYSRNTEFSHISGIKKRSHRCHMTLNEPLLNELPYDIQYDRMGKGDSNYRNIELIPRKHLDMSISADSFGKNTQMPNAKTIEMPNLQDNFTNFLDKSNFIDTSEASPVHNPIKAQDIPANEVDIFAGKLSKQTFEMENVLPLEAKESVGTVRSIAAEPKSSNCSCVLTVLDKPHKRADCGLVTLSSDGLPKCCPCIVDQVSSTPETIVRSQAEILLEKSGPPPGKVFRVTLICKNCIKGLKNADAFINTMKTESSKNPDVKHEYIIVSEPEKRFKNVDVQTEYHDISGELLEYKAMGSGSLLLNKENNACLMGREKLEEVVDVNYQNFIKSSDSHKISCYHSCFTICSDDSMCSNTSDHKFQNSFCLDCADTEYTKELNIGNDIFHYYSNKNEEYSVENIANQTTIFHFNGQEDIMFYKIIPDEKCDFCHDKKKNRDNTTNVKHVEHKENNENQYLISIKYNNDEPYKRLKNVKNVSTQVNTIETNLIAEDKTDVSTRNTPYKSIIQKEQKTDKKIKTATVGKNAYTSFKKSMLKTIKENDSEQNGGCNNLHHIHPPPLPKANASTNYIVNCVQSIEYDILSKNRNSVFACSVNAFSSKNRKI